MPSGIQLDMSNDEEIIIELEQSPIPDGCMRRMDEVTVASGGVKM